MDRKLKLFKKIFPWYMGLSGDLLFWIAIDTLFLTTVKNFSPSQIVSLTSISLVGSIILQMPVLWIVKKVGNTVSIRLGTFLLLCSALFITFGNSFYLVAFGKIIYYVAFAFKNMLYASLKNNLSYMDMEEEYVHYRTRGMTVYSVVTMIVSFVASFMFNLNNYLPMYACITCCVISFVLSFFMFDVRDYDKSFKTETQEGKKSTKKNFTLTPFLLLEIITYALVFAVVVSGQSESKLVIQDTLFNYFEVEKVSLLIGLMVTISRVVRTMSNLVFNKFYVRFKNYIVFYLSILLLLSMSILIFAYYVDFSIIVKYVLMVLAYIIILFMRDPFNSCMQEIMLKHCNLKSQQTVLTVSEFAYRIFYAVMSFSFSLLVLKMDLIIMIIIFAVLEAIGVICAYFVCRLNKKMPVK